MVDDTSSFTVKTTIRFWGVAAFELVTAAGKRVLIDPFFDGNPGATKKSKDFDSVDVILVSHAAYDHLGDTEAIARRTGAAVVCGVEVKEYLTAKGIPAQQIRTTVWGIAVEVGGIRIQPVECHHWSQIKLPNGQYASGVPMGFVVYPDPDVRFYHYGDTALFSDLKLIGELYRPNIGCLGITNPIEIEDQTAMPGHMLTAEMSPGEGAIAAQWLGLDTVLPCHYINPDCDDVREFERHLAEASSRGERVPRCYVLRPGETLNGRL